MLRVGAVVACLLVAGCSSSTSGTGGSDTSAPESSAPASPYSVTGTIVVGSDDIVRDTDGAGSPCYTSGNSPVFPSASDYDDIKDGAQVTVLSGSGTTLGLGKLAAGQTTSASRRPDCGFAFIVANIPAGEKFYTVKVGTHSHQVAENELTGNVTLHFP